MRAETTPPHERLRPQEPPRYGSRRPNHRARRTQ
jgi:hypothetical protein